jgi:hypothetical protein
VVAQDTGFGAYLPIGDGLFAFSTVDEAVTAMDAVDQDYPRHCRRAREIAEEYFRSELVLGKQLELAGAAPGAARSVSGAVPGVAPDAIDRGEAVFRRSL